MSTHPKFCTVAYVISCLLDAVDGMAARALGQTSKFGAVLDMVTDRSVAPGPTSRVAYSSIRIAVAPLPAYFVFSLPPILNGLYSFNSSSPSTLALTTFTCMRTFIILAILRPLRQLIRNWLPQIPRLRFGFTQSRHKEAELDSVVLLQQQRTSPRRLSRGILMISLFSRRHSFYSAPETNYSSSLSTS